MTDHGSPPPLGAARRAHILSELYRHGVVRNSQLIDELGVTPVTLRRDLAQMEQEGVLVRIHGGAIPPVADPDEPPASWTTITGRKLAVLVPALNYYWPGVVRGMEQEARRRGVELLVRAASYTLQDERPILERFVTLEGVDGLLVAPNTDTPHTQDVIQWLADSDVPSVLVERDGIVLPDYEPVESVTTDHALGALLAARHLAALGHRTVGLVIARDSPTSRKITQGWDAACREFDLTPTEHFESFLPDRNKPEFSAAVDAALDTAVALGATALLVHPDPEAMAFADLAVARGISVPEELSIIAYDDEVAAIFAPPLTAIRPPREALGAAAVDLLLRRLQDPTRPVHRVTISPALNIRESSAPARKK